MQLVATGFRSAETCDSEYLYSTLSEKSVEKTHTINDVERQLGVKHPISVKYVELDTR